MGLDGFKPGLDQRFFLIAGPCAIESRDHAFETAAALKEITAEAGVQFIYKSSYDKANRTSSKSYRGPGLAEGLDILASVSAEHGVPVLTDVHTVDEAKAAGESVDVIQIPAFLCRQTDLVQAAAETGRWVNVKKGQFLAPGDMVNVVNKAVDAGAAGRCIVTERGASFGYNNLVVDMRSLATMRATGCPVVFDATHSVQLPGGGGDRSDGQREFVPVLARAAVAAGVSGLFMETHQDPDSALSDGPNAWPLGMMAQLLDTLVAIDTVAKASPFAEDAFAS